VTSRSEHMRRRARIGGVKVEIQGVFIGGLRMRSDSVAVGDEGVMPC
jgi:hypothetical protein